MVLVTEKPVKDLIYEGEERKQSWRSVRTQAQVKGAGKAVKPHLKEGWKEKSGVGFFLIPLLSHIYKIISASRSELEASEIRVR